MAQAQGARRGLGVAGLGLVFAGAALILNSTRGRWAALGGFVPAGVGATLGPHRRAVT